MSLAVATTLYSQIKFMPKAGVSLSNVSFSDDFKSPGEKYKSKIGMIIGVAVEIPLIGEMLALQPELLFHQKGFKYEDPGDGEYTQDATITTNYMELPILAKVKFGKFYAIAGPSFGYGIGGKYKSTFNDLYLGTSTETSGDVKFGTEPSNSTGDVIYVDNALDINVQVGVGMKISVIVIDLRYGIGLSNLYDQPSGSTMDNKSKNGSLQLTVGVPFPMGD